VYNPVSDCDAYDADYSCVSCKAGFYRTTNTDCRQAKVPNCLVFAGPDTCSQCEKGFQLLVSGAKTGCIDVGMKECLEYDHQLPSL
jgi:hypothetical protein